jgi:hypothetical protein
LPNSQGREKLLELLIQYSIGVTKKSIEYIGIDANKLAQCEVQEAEELAQ